MTLRSELFKFSTLLTQRGFAEEAKLVERMAHFMPENTENVPSFFRRNFDYGEGFYYGNMSEKPSISEWRKKHKNKGPNFPKKKKEAALNEEDSVHNYLIGNDRRYKELWDRVQSLRADVKLYQIKMEQSLEQYNEGEAREHEETLDQLQAYLRDAEDRAQIYKGRQSRKVKEQNLDELVGQADKLINPKTLLDHFRLALLQQNYEEAGKIVERMSPEEKKEAEGLAKNYHEAKSKMFTKTASIFKVGARVRLIKSPEKVGTLVTRPQPYNGVPQYGVVLDLAPGEKPSSRPTILWVPEDQLAEKI